MTKASKTQDIALAEGRRILCLLKRQNYLLAEMCKLLRKAVAQDGRIARKPRRSKDQLRQLSIALAEVEKDPLHNVKRAAEQVFKTSKGYSSAKTLEVVLRKKWNSRVE